VKDFFDLNRSVVLFIYGQAFFVMGLAIFLQSRRHSRLQLARDLRWLAGFGITHGLHEWGLIFIPLQAQYLPLPYTQLLGAFQVFLLGGSFSCLMGFGAAVLRDRWRHALWIPLLASLLWIMLFWFILQKATAADEAFLRSAVWARYLLGFPGALLAAYGLRYQAQVKVAPLGGKAIARTLRVAGIALVAYAVLGGLLVSPAPFFPANLLNKSLIEVPLGVPIEVFRSMAGVALAIAMIRALEVFEIEVERMIARLEVERIQAAERDRIGQEIHDGALQGVYSANLILETLASSVQADSVAAGRLTQVSQVLDSVIVELRRYLQSLKPALPDQPLRENVRQLAANPRFSGLMDIVVSLDVEPDLTPVQAGDLLAITQEALSNAARHSGASRVTITLREEEGRLVYRIADNGAGFDPAASRPGVGLSAIQDRARSLGAGMELRSGRGKGTQIIVRLSEREGDGADADRPGR